MIQKDALGHSLSGANGVSTECYQRALDQLHCYVGDPMADAQAAAQAAPEMAMAHVLAAYLVLSSTEPAAPALARGFLDSVRQLALDEREAGHLMAAQLWCDGSLLAAARVLEDVSLAYPHDLLALQMGHLLDFCVGRSRMLRDRIARAACHWHDGMPGHHAVLSMLAFGLVETADYARAEDTGRRAVALEPQDGWAWHAVAHVMEMQNRPADGVAWLAPNANHWHPGSFFSVHNWWHLALFQLGLNQFDEVLRLVDERVLGDASPLVLNMIDASAMLWRLELLGVPVGDRWSGLADRWTAASVRSTYAFNDLHAMMAFVGAGRYSDAERLIAAQAAALDGAGDNTIFLRDVGGAATRAFYEFGQGRYAEAARRLRDVRPVAANFGGSHAQRDIIDLTLIKSAENAGDHKLADGLRAERRYVLDQFEQQSGGPWHGR